MRRALPTAVLLCVAVLVSACAPSSEAVAQSSAVRDASIASPPAIPVALRSFYEQTLQWKPCRKVLECASFAVPIDYAKPGGGTIRIAVARARATGTSRGPLVINPGGPGGSGIAYIADPSYAVSSTARRNFDLVSFDPRGVGASAPLWCYRGKQLDAFLDIDPTPDTAREAQAVVAAGRQLARACERENRALLPHLSTADMARDLDVLRGVLGESRLRYIGKSWGTALGTVYAALFPGRVGSFVLDGAVDLQLAPQQAVRDQGQGFEIAVNRFVAWCIEQGRCPLGATRTKAKQRLVSFIDALDEHPLATGNPARPLTESQAFTAVIGPLYVADGGWDWLLSALKPALAQGRGAPLQAIFDWFVERNANGSYANNANTVIYAVNCLDGPAATASIAQAQGLAQRWTRTMPFMGRVMAWGDLPCARWPYRAKTDIAELRVRRVPPMLVVSATFDPATPMQWGRALAREIPGAVLLTRDGDGHTSYASNSLCIDRAVDAFLLSTDPVHPELPPAGKRCV